MTFTVRVNKHNAKLSGGQLELGPLIGYFISNRKMNDIKAGIHDSVYITFIKSARTLGGEVFIFSIDDVNWADSTITGYTINSDYPDKFSSRVYPMPRVIYNRCFGSGSTDQIKQLRTGIMQKNIILTGLKTPNQANYAVAPNSVFEPAKILSCPVEVTILVQRDYQGEWQYTAGVIRLNLSMAEQKSGRYFKNYPLESGLFDIFSKEYRKVKTALIEQSIKEAKKLGQNSPGLIELNIRLKLDRNGQGHITKVYRKPIKEFATNFKGSSAAYLSIVRPLHYCFFLAGFPLTKEFYLPRRATPENRVLIGIFEESSEITDLEAQKAGYYQYLLARSGKELGCTTYHFSLNNLKDIDCIEGWYYDFEKQKWLQREFPWPHVLYDRATFPYSSQREKAKEFRKDLKRFGRTIFLNSRSVFGKGYTSDILTQMPILKSYLPYNVNNPSPQTVKDMLKKYNSIFIKTEHGSNLEGVLKITRQNRTYLMSNKYRNISFPDFGELWTKVTGIIDTKPFVAQEGIRVMPYRSQPLNVRTIVQKNGEGSWVVGLVKPWIATTPDIRGYPLNWAKAMSDTFSPDKSASIYEEICNVSLNVAKTMEAHVGNLGELGIDLVLDPSGHPWIVEVNGKTNKLFFLKDEKPDSNYNLYFNPIAYSCYLADNYCY